MIAVHGSLAIWCVWVHVLQRQPNQTQCQADLVPDTDLAVAQLGALKAWSLGSHLRLTLTGRTFDHRGHKMLHVQYKPSTVQAASGALPWRFSSACNMHCSTLDQGVPRIIC